MTLFQYKTAALSVTLRGCSLLCNIATSIVIARTLGPDKLGISTYYLAIAASIALGFTLNQDAQFVRRIILLSETSAVSAYDEALKCFWFRNYVWIFTTLLSAVFLTKISQGYAYIGALLFGYSLVNPSLWIFQVLGEIKTFLCFSALQALCTLILSLYIIEPSSSAGTDLMIAGASSLAIAITSWIYALGKFNQRYYHPKVSVTEIVKHYYHGRWLIAIGLAVYAYTKLEQPLVGLLSGMNALGQYRTALQVSNAVGSITGLVAAFLYPQFVKLHSENPAKLFDRQCEIGAKIAVIATVSLLVARPAIAYFYPIVFGIQYSEAANAAFLLCASQFVISLNGVFCWGLYAAKKEKSVAILLMLTAATSILLNIHVIPTYGITAAATVNLMSETVVLVGSILLSRRYLKT